MAVVNQLFQLKAKFSITLPVLAKVMTEQLSARWLVERLAGKAA